MNRRRFIAATAVGLLTAPGAACARESEPTPGNPVTIEYWHINTEAFGAKAVNELVNKFNESHPTVSVEAKFHDGYDKLTAALQSAVAAGKAPDVAQIGYSRSQYIAENFPYVSMSDLHIPTNGYVPNILSLGQIDGKQVALPYGLSVLLVYYNKNLLAQAGIDPEHLPVTWNEWTRAAEQMKAGTGLPLINFQQFAGDNYIPQAMIGSNGGSVLRCSEGTPAATFDSDQGIEAIGLMGDLVRKGLATNLNSGQSLQAFLGGRSGTLITSSASRANLESQAGFPLGATTFPMFGSKPLSLPAGGNNLFVFSKSKTKQAATKQFVEFIATNPDSVATWVAGTGYIPAIPTATGSEKDPLQAIAERSAGDLTPWVSFPGANGLQASQIMYDATQSIMGGTASATDALKGAAKEINSQLDGAHCG